MRHFSYLLIALVLFSTGVQGQTNTEGAYLDPAYDNLVHPIEDQRNLKELTFRNDVESVLQQQSPVRSQGAHGTCSIFSATALIESLMVIHGLADNREINLSEQYLQYLVNAGKTTEGSHALNNFAAILGNGSFARNRDRGMAREQTLPYNPQSLAHNTTLAQDICGHLRDDRLHQSCLNIHRDPQNIFRTIDQLLDPTRPYYDPELVEARKEARDFTNNYLRSSNYSRLFYTSQIKSMLDRGIPVIVEMDFYYGAWNHPAADNYDIGRSMDHWYRGIIGHAEPGSMDIVKSKEEPSGHSVLLVGYDDQKVVTTKVKMQDGSYREFSYRGVYYFKNSWGTNSFGRDFTFEGQAYPGYGMMTQRHANQHGSFYYFRL